MSVNDFERAVSTRIRPKDINRIPDNLYCKILNAATPQKLAKERFKPEDVVNDPTTFPAYITRTGRWTMFASTIIEINLGFPPLHFKSTDMPPRTRAPLIDPVDHCLGRAGRIVIVRSVPMLATSGA